MANGMWSLTAVACVELQCIDPPPPISNGFSLPSSPPYTVGSEVTYNCDNGYQIQFPDNEQGLATTIFCKKNAQWNRVPICKKSPRGLSLSNGLAVAVGIFAFLFIVSLCFAIVCSLWAFYLRRQLTCGDMAEDEVAYAQSHGAFTLNNPIVTATVKDEESAGNPLYLTPDEMNEFESKKRQLGSTG